MLQRREIVIMVAADSITDSQFFHGSPISRDVFKTRKAHLLMKRKQGKTNARRSQWIHQCEEEDGFSSRLRDKPLLDIKTLTDRFSHFQAWSADDETSLSAASSSPRSVLKNKESDSGDDDDDCFCCSKQVTEEAFVDADSDDYSDAFSMFDEEDEKKDEDVCPLCCDKMDATDLLLKPCSRCKFKLCLFCYDKINKEGNGACPACNKKYEPQQTGSNSGGGGGVTFQQRGHAPVSLTSSFQALADDDTA